MRKPTRIENLFLNITTECNMPCKRCYGHLHPVKETMMSLATAQKATRLYFEQRKENKDLSYIMLFGGEPLLNWKMIEQYLPWVTQKYVNKSFRIFLFTNGLLLNDEVLDFLNRFNVLIFLSMDGDYEQYAKIRPIDISEYNRIVDTVKINLKKYPQSMIPYVVMPSSDFNRFEKIMDSLVSMGFKVIAVTKEMGERIPFRDRFRVFKSIVKYRLTHGVRILPYPEVVCNCHSCVPRNAMVYPDGKVYDICYVSGAVLFHKGCISKEQLRAFQMGELNDPYPFVLNHLPKRRILCQNGTCPTVSEWISIFHPFYPLVSKNIPHFHQKKNLETLQ